MSSGECVMGSEIIRVVEVLELKAQLTDCIRAVGKGELVIILEDGIPVAQILPPESSETTETDSRQKM
jgi:antitoxin (DNA-binding transcriptional repressor) of toxin-antitoxin stability system